MKKMIGRAMQFFSGDAKGICMKGQFIDLIGFVPRQDKEKELAIHRNFNYIHQDIWNLSTIFHRLEWYRQLVINDSENFFGNWMAFAKLDIDHFHVEFRSIFDYIANCISFVSEQPNTVRHKDWQQLFNWLERNKGNEKRLGKQFVPLVQSAKWVLDIIEIRDNIVHFGGDTLVFTNPKDGILFQCYFGKNYKPKIDLSIVMYNKHVARFELYSALFFSQLICFLDDFATILNTTLKPNTIGTNACSYSPGFGVIKKWMEELNIKINS